MATTAAGYGAPKKAVRWRTPGYFDLLALNLLLLPLWGYAIIPIGPRGIQLNWVLGLLMGGLLVTEVVLGVRRLRDPVGSYLLLLFQAALLLSLYEPLAQGRGAGLVDWTTTYFQFLAGAAMLFTFINLRASKRTVRRLIDVQISLAAILGLFGVVQFVGSFLGFDLNPAFLNPGIQDAASAYVESTGPFSRSTGLFEEPRQFGGYLIGGMVMAIGMLLFDDSRERSSLHSWGLMAIMAGLITSLSGSALLVAGLVLALTFLVFVPFLHEKGRFPVTPLLLLGTAVASFSVFVFRSEHVLAVFVRNKVRPPDLRLLWEHAVFLDVGRFGWFRYIGSFGAAVRTWLLSPLSGVGLNNLEYYSVGVLSNRFTGAFGPVRFLAETGIVGVVGLSLLLGYVLARLLRMVAREKRERLSSRFATMGLLLLLATLLRSFATNIYAMQSIFFWTEVALAVVLLRHAEAAMSPDGAAGAGGDR